MQYAPVAAAAPGRRDRARHAGVGGGEALERRSGVLPRAKRRGAASTGRRIGYGELAATPRACPFPTTWRSSVRRTSLIGTPAKRLDTPAKVNGTAMYGIDARPPGVKIDARAIAGVRRSREERRRCRGQGGQGRAPGGAAR
jgi:hypothetical protein